MIRRPHPKSRLRLGAACTVALGLCACDAGSATQAHFHSEVAPVGLPPVMQPTTAATDGADARITNDFWIVPPGQAPASSDANLLVFTQPPNGVFVTGGRGESEALVFFRALQHIGDHPWEIRVGPSGHIYSIPHTLGHDENVCCTDEYQLGAAWNDRVWQTNLGAVGGKPGTNLQQAGAYGDNTNPQYSPNLAVAQLSREDFSVVTLPLYAAPGDPNLQNANDINDWPWVLLQQHVRDVGHGVIELTYVYHNYGPLAYNFMDLWGAAKYPELSGWVASSPDGTYSFVDRLNTPFDSDGLLQPDMQSGGWMAFATSPNSDASALAIIYSAANANIPNWQRFGHNNSNMYIATQSIFEEGISNQVFMSPGQVFYRRIFMVLSDVNDVSTRAVPAYRPYVSQGVLTFQNETAGFVRASYVEQTQHVVVPQNDTWCAIDRPVPNALPLFLIACDGSDTTGVVTSNPRQCGPAQTSNKLLAFLGWGIRVRGAAPTGLPGMLKLSSVLSAAAYPDPMALDPAVRTDVWVSGGSPP